MEILIVDRSKKNCAYKANYVAAFAPGSVKNLMPCIFPERPNPLDVEKMLHLLNSMCNFPQVFNYIRSSIPSPFFLPA